MKLAILGNSHAACLIAAVRDYPDVLGADIEPVFFAAIGKNIADLELNGGALVPRTEFLTDQIVRSSGGLNRLEIADYDAFLLVGMGFRISLTPRSYSEAVLRTAMRNKYDLTNHWRLARDIRRVSDQPMLCLPQPQYAEASEVPEGQNFVSYDEMLDLAENLTADLRPIILRQPEETRERDLFTWQRYTSGSQRLSASKHSSADTHHMNAEYGALCLKAAKAVLTGQ